MQNVNNSIQGYISEHLKTSANYSEITAQLSEAKDPWYFIASSNNTDPKIAPCITKPGNKRSGKVSTGLLLVAASNLFHSLLVQNNHATPLLPAMAGELYSRLIFGSSSVCADFSQAFDCVCIADGP